MLYKFLSCKYVENYFHLNTLQTVQYFYERLHYVRIDIPIIYKLFKLSREL